MYINKRKLQAIESLTLRLKVAGKNHGAAERGTSEWHESWNVAEYSHKAIQALLGDTEAANRLAEVAEYDDSAQAAISTLRYHGINIQELV